MVSPLAWKARETPAPSQAMETVAARAQPWQGTATMVPGSGPGSLALSEGFYCGSPRPHMEGRQLAGRVSDIRGQAQTWPGIHQCLPSHFPGWVCGSLGRGPSQMCGCPGSGYQSKCRPSPVPRAASAPWDSANRTGSVVVEPRLSEGHSQKRLKLFLWTQNPSGSPPGKETLEGSRVGGPEEGALRRLP